MNKLLIPVIVSMATCLALAVPGTAQAQAAEPALASTVHGKAFELARHEETQSATVTNVDQQSRFVTLRDAKGTEFTIPDGKQRKIEVTDPMRQARMSQLKVGDLVRMTYVEGVAVQVTPKAAGKP
jgi:Cu/Ag efflux protein CusF